ncbi:MULTISPECIES: ABC transporter ATP-binding protein [unclassified Leucobacter]|uniref:ABC transporter ATP-binding protein n=1 Tax=unclassified Leucobacter TaxID=2621730 RepID=UPI001BFE858C|nr:MULTISPECIES: ABC transporter ATP-binding protein [unclassified Leucobacter]
MELSTIETEIGSPGGSSVELRQLSKRYGDNAVVNSIDLVIEQGEFFALLGSSGCGKTTTLRMIAGLETPSSGQILLDGKDIVNVRAAKREVNTVFQNFALFPHLTVFENVAFGLRRRQAKNIEARVATMLNTVQMTERADFLPEQLSGGQKQRIALARALINSPKALLLDEPLGALDMRLRRDLQVELKHMQQRLGLTFIHVTHDQEEAMSMADRIAVMSDGRIEQIGSPRELYDNPNSEFVATFLGSSNLIAAERVSDTGVTLLGTGIDLPKDRMHHPIGQGSVGVRPEKVRLLPAEQAGQPMSGTVQVSGYVTSTVFQGSTVQYRIQADNELDLQCFTQNLSSDMFRPGDPVAAQWDARDSFFVGLRPAA